MSLTSSYQRLKNVESYYKHYNKSIHTEFGHFFHFQDKIFLNCKFRIVYSFRRVCKEFSILKMQNTFIHFMLIIPFCLLVGLSYGQVIADYNDISIFFGDKQKSRSNVEDFIKTESGELICIQNHLSFINILSKNTSKYSFDFVTDNHLPAFHPISFYGDGKNTNLTHQTILGNNILGISHKATFLNKDPQLYYHIINPNTQGKSNHGFSFGEDLFFSKEIDISRIQLVSSENKKYASMIYFPETRTNEYTHIKYLNFSNDLAKPQRGNFTYPFPTKDYKILDIYIKDQETQFLVAGHYFQNQTKINWINQDKFYQSITIGKIKNQEFEYVEVESEGYFFTGIGLYGDGDLIILSGLYSPFIDGSIKGVFTAKINKDGKIKDKKFTPFTKEIISKIDESKINLLDDQYTISNAYKGFEISEFRSIQGGYIGIAEFNALQYKYGSSDVPGATNTIDSYFWSDDIIVFKLSLNGELEWNKIIPKYQRTINDGGYYLSYTTYFTPESLHLFFNDNLMNYNQKGVYNKYGEPPFAAQFSSGKNTIAHASLRLSDGFMQRKSTIGKEETNLLFIPLLSRTFTKTEKLMIYGRSGNRHRIGSINFRE